MDVLHRKSAGLQAEVVVGALDMASAHIDVAAAVKVQPVSIIVGMVLDVYKRQVLLSVLAVLSEEGAVPPHPASMAAVIPAAIKTDNAFFMVFSFSLDLCVLFGAVPLSL